MRGGSVRRVLVVGGIGRGVVTALHEGAQVHRRLVAGLEGAFAVHLLAWWKSMRHRSFRLEPREAIVVGLLLVNRHNAPGERDVRGQEAELAPFGLQVDGFRLVGASERENQKPWLGRLVGFGNGEEHAVESDRCRRIRRGLHFVGEDDGAQLRARRRFVEFPEDRIIVRVGERQSSNIHRHRVAMLKGEHSWGSGHHCARQLVDVPLSAYGERHLLHCGCAGAYCEYGGVLQRRESNHAS
mmetsp:Transcript_10797/g.25927  ORF Transcript_10797/g.25927 Transcript_10797/m.25927 type:complete len:241 (+) Transcript_10797:1634-2356(+)